MKDLGRRLFVSSIVIAIVVVLLLFAKSFPFSYLISVLLALLGAVAIWEYAQFAKAKGVQMIVSVLAPLAGIGILSFYPLPWTPLLPILVFFVGFLILFAFHFRQKEGAIVNLAVSTFGLIYIAVPLGMILGMLYGSGPGWIAYLLIVTKITDIGAYFGGSLWGKRLLAPSISPKKTVEGALCGLLCAMAASLGFLFFARLSFTEALTLGILLGVIGQFSDLAESLLKRDANKKDSNTLPGLGGVLDSIDSLLFNAPILYVYLHL